MKRNYSTERQETVVLPFADAKVKVLFDFDPPEAPVFYPNDRAYPGTPGEITINRVLILTPEGEVDLKESLHEATLQRIEEDLWLLLNEPPEDY